jgi:hypothetical protein
MIRLVKATDIIKHIQRNNLTKIYKNKKTVNPTLYPTSPIKLIYNDLLRVKLDRVK